jgi:shikimate kinase
MYNEKVMEAFQNPKNVGEIENADGVGKVGNASCGDIMQISLKIENDIICAQNYHSSVVATGGSAVYGEEAMAHLRKDGVTVYLEISLAEIEKRIGNIKTRGVAMKNGETLESLYAEREPLYNKYADVTVNCEGLTAEECVEKIISSL